MDKCGRPVDWEHCLPSRQLYFLVMKMNSYSNVTKMAKLRTMVAQWTTWSENDLSIPVSSSLSLKWIRRENKTVNALETSRNDST